MYRWRLLSAVVGVVCCLLLAACGPGRPKRPTRTEALRDDSTPPAVVTTRGLKIRWRKQVPGKPALPMLDLDAVSGNLDSASQSGQFADTTGILYDAGQPRATFSAPRVKAEQDNRVVQAEGGVRIESVAPKGTVITADRVTWYASGDEIRASGNVCFVHRPAGSNDPEASGGPFERVTVNTALKKVRIP